MDYTTQTKKELLALAVSRELPVNGSLNKVDIIAVLTASDATTAPTGLKIEKDRPMQNGIKRPSIGGKCRAVWDALDAYRAETGEAPTAKVVAELAADENFNPNNASIEFYQWRKFNGIKGRAAKPAATPEATPEAPAPVAADAEA